MNFAALITAALGTLVLAAPHNNPNDKRNPAYYILSLVLMSTAVANAIATTTSSDVPGGGITVSAGYDVPTNMSNGLRALSAAVGGDKFIINVTMGGRPTRVGQYRGQEMYDFVKKSVWDICDSKGWCLTGVGDKISGVKYIDSKGRLATNAHMVISVVSYNWEVNWEPQSTNLVDSLIDVGAYICKVQTDIPGNCLDKIVKTNDENGTVRAIHCQVGGTVKIQAYGTKHRELFLEVKVAFNTSTRLDQRRTSVAGTTSRSKSSTTSKATSLPSRPMRSVGPPSTSKRPMRLEFHLGDTVHGGLSPSGNRLLRDLGR